MSPKQPLWPCSCWKALPEETSLGHLAGGPAAGEVADIAQSQWEGELPGKCLRAGDPPWDCSKQLWCLQERDGRQSRWSRWEREAVSI